MHFPRLFALFLLTPLLHAEPDAPDLPRAYESPDILLDRRVTFSFEAPLADSVKLRGITRSLLDLIKGPKGLWSITVGPLDPGIYEYSFMVDGEEILDPSNPKIKPELNPDSSLLEIPSATPLFYQWRDVPHGTIHLHEYFSPSLKRLRRLRVYTPPGYDTHPDEHFPVLYLFHGTGDTEATWTEFGHAHLILDNLLAEHQCCPMIIVMPDGHADLKEEEGIHKANFLKFEKDVVESVLPMVDKTYRSQPTPAGRAISGLSMGGMQALQIGLNHADLFGSIGAMSAYVPEPDDLLKPRFANTTESAAHQFLWAQIGRDDYLRAETEKFHDLLAKHGIQQQLTLTDGSHEWTVWRKYLDDFAKVVFRPTGKS